MKERYETERLILKILNESDADELLQFLSSNREAFEEYEAERAPGFYSYAYQLKVVLAEQKLFRESRGVRYWIYKKTEPSVLIGSVNFAHLQDPDKPCSIGYKLAPEFRGQGFAYEAASFLLKTIIDEFPIERIIADIHPSNLPSQKLIGKLGFKYETTAFRSHEIKGILEDHLRYVFFP